MLEHGAWSMEHELKLTLILGMEKSIFLRTSKDSKNRI